MINAAGQLHRWAWYRKPGFDFGTYGHQFKQITKLLDDDKAGFRFTVVTYSIPKQAATHAYERFFMHGMKNQGRGTRD
jgi:hypothetical protein